MKFNVKVEYGQIPITNISVQCPRCEQWHIGRMIGNTGLGYKDQIYTTRFECPECGTEFGKLREFCDDPIIEEGRFPDIYKDCDY